MGQWVGFFEELQKINFHVLMKRYNSTYSHILCAQHTMYNNYVYVGLL